MPSDSDTPPVSGHADPTSGAPFREATIADAEALVPLFDAFLADQLALQPFAPRNPLFRTLPWLLGRLRDPSMFALVATHKGAIVAVGEGSVRTANPGTPTLAWHGVRPLLRSAIARLTARSAATYIAPRRVGTIVTIYVAPEARGRGLGEQLTRAVAATLQRRGAEVVYTQVLAQNPARAMYDACGMVPESVQLRWPDA